MRMNSKIYKYFSWIQNYLKYFNVLKDLIIETATILKHSNNSCMLLLSLITCLSSKIIEIGQKVSSVMKNEILFRLIFISKF